MENWRISRIEDELQGLPNFSDDPDLQKYLSGACFRERKNLYTVEDEGFSEEQSTLGSSSSNSDLPSKLADINLENGIETDNFLSSMDNNVISRQSSWVDASITIKQTLSSSGIDQTSAPKISIDKQQPGLSENTKGFAEIEEPKAMAYIKNDKFLPPSPAAAAKHFTDKYDSPERLQISRAATLNNAVTHSKSWHGANSVGKPTLSTTPNLSSLRSPNIPRANTGYSLARRDAPELAPNNYGVAMEHTPTSSPQKVKMSQEVSLLPLPKENGYGSSVHGRQSPNAQFSSVVHSPTGSPSSEPLTEHEILQVEVFYRSHMTDVVTCQCLVEMYYGKARDRSSRESSKDFDLSRWTYCTSGIPVLVLDSGDSRCRQRNLSIILAERGTGFMLWKESVNHLTNYQPLLNNFHSLHTSKDHTKLVGFRFKDNIAASDFFHKYQTIITNPDDDLLNLGSKSKKSKKGDKKSSKKSAVRKPIKADISSPCCFTHITTVDKNFGALNLDDSATGGSIQNTDSTAG